MDTINGFCCNNVGDIVINELKIRHFGDRIGNILNNLFAQDTYSWTNKYHNADKSNRSVKNCYQQFCHQHQCWKWMTLEHPFQLAIQKMEVIISDKIIHLQNYVICTKRNCFRWFRSSIFPTIDGDDRMRILDHLKWKVPQEHFWTYHMHRISTRQIFEPSFYSILTVKQTLTFGYSKKLFYLLKNIFLGFSFDFSSIRIWWFNM